MSLARRERSRTKVLYVGEKAEAIFNALWSIATSAPMDDVFLLLSHVPGVAELWYEQPGVRIFFYDSSGILNSAKLWFHREDKALIAEADLPDDVLRSLIERLVVAIYNYILALRSYYGRARWANTRWDILRAVTYDRVEERIASTLPELAVLDPDLVSNIVYVLSNEFVRLSIPTGVVSAEELREQRERAKNRRDIEVETRVGPYIAEIIYKPYVHYLIIGLRAPDENGAGAWEDATVILSVLVGENNVSFELDLRAPASPSFVRWVIENRCSIVLYAVEAIERRVLGDSELLENIRLFRRAVEVACKLSAKGF
ncbi:MAG: hypothetical protein QXE92_03250 [Thermofilaceae archaeon]